MPHGHTNMGTPTLVPNIGIHNIEILQKVAVSSRQEEISNWSERKGLVDFLKQLKIKDLENLLHAGDRVGFLEFKMPAPMSPEAVGSYLKFAPPSPPVKIEYINQERAQYILKLLSKISSLAHFSHHGPILSRRIMR